MSQITLRLDDDLLAALDDEADERDVSRSQHIREAIESRREADELRRELEQAEAQVADLRRQLQQANARQDDVGKLVEYVEEERAMQQRERERRDAPLWTRAKWYVFGRAENEIAAGIE